MVQEMVRGVSRRDLITAFAGLRPVLDTEDFYIDLSANVPHFVQVAGIQSPGLTALPDIGEYVKDLLKKGGQSRILAGRWAMNRWYGKEKLNNENGIL